MLSVLASENNRRQQPMQLFDQTLLSLNVIRFFKKKGNERIFGICMHAYYSNNILYSVVRKAKGFRKINAIQKNLELRADIKEKRKKEKILKNTECFI